MSDFLFNGNWETKIKLVELSKLKKLKHSTNKKISLSKDEILMIIEKYENQISEPKKKQTNTINYLLDTNNQIQIIESIFNYIKEIIFPEIIQFYEFPEEEYPDEFSNLKSSNDLNDLIELRYITIHNLHNNENAIFTLTFESLLGRIDGELNLTFNKSIILDHIQWNSWPSDQVVIKLGGRILSIEEIEAMEKIEKEKKNDKS